jgi:hypothetical protein
MLLVCICRQQSRAEQNRTEQNRTEQNRTEQNRTEQNRTEQKWRDKSNGMTEMILFAREGGCVCSYPVSVEDDTSVY